MYLPSIQEQCLNFDRNYPCYKDMYSPEQYSELAEYIVSFIGADCWAIVENGQIMYNSYQKDDANLLVGKDLCKNFGFENREAWYEKPENALSFVKSFFSQNSSLEIYMFGDPYEWKLVLSSVDGIVKPSFYISEGYKRRFGDSI